jgi:hypothetical protein
MELGFHLLNTLFRRAALIPLLVCAVSDAIILWKSDGQELNTWTASPSLLLAVLLTLANVCLQYAHSQGVVIA